MFWHILGPNEEADALRQPSSDLRMLKLSKCRWHRGKDSNHKTWESMKRTSDLEWLHSEPGGHTVTFNYGAVEPKVWCRKALKSLQSLLRRLNLNDNRSDCNDSTKEIWAMCQTWWSSKLLNDSFSFRLCSDSVATSATPIIRFKCDIHAGLLPKSTIHH